MIRMKQLLGKEETGTVAGYALLVIMVLGVVIFGAIKIWHRQSGGDASNKTGQSSSGSQASKASQALTGGNDDASLNKDLANIDSAIDENGQNLSAADNATNDEQHIINVPVE